MSRALSRAWFCVLAAGAVLASTTACTGLPMPAPTTAMPSPSGDGVLRIGTLFPASGELAALSPGQVAGVNAAVRELNAAGGVLGAPVEVVSRDAGADDGATAGAAFDELVSLGADVVIGPSSSAAAESLLSAAAAASVPLISPSATDPALAEADAGGWFFRTIPTDADEGALLAARLVARGAAQVALVGAGGEPGEATTTALAAALSASDAELTEIPGDADPADVAAQVAAAGPDAVVLAAGESAAALILALSDAGYGGDSLWLVGPSAVSFGDDVPEGSLTGATAVIPAFAPDADLRARFRLEDPGARNLRSAAEAYDATILAALAAVLANDDGGASIGHMLPSATAGGIPCGSFGECVDVLTTQDDIDYRGVTGSLDLDESGDLAEPGLAVYGYSSANTLEFAEWTLG